MKLAVATGLLTFIVVATALESSMDEKEHNVAQPSANLHRLELDSADVSDERPKKALWLDNKRALWLDNKKRALWLDNKKRALWLDNKRALWLDNKRNADNDESSMDE